MNAKNVRLFYNTAAFFAVMFLSSIAFAQGDQPDTVGRMDTDNDGKVSKSEWTGDPKAFAKYDKNNDGFIASDEKPTGMPTLDLLDKNGDGKVTKDEFPADAREGMFDEFDRDNDGSLNESEIASPPAGGGGAPGAGGAQGGAAPGSAPSGDVPSSPSGMTVQ